ncbi:MAG: DUF1206 domain-containing protein [Candidatus Competibacteraceae bacterium]
MARWGYGARGVVYLIVGALALVDALSAGSNSTDPEKALVQLFNKPLGTILLMLVAIGLAGFALWRLLQAFLDADHLGHEVTGLAMRGGYLISAIAYIGLTVFALSLIFHWGIGGGNSDSSARDWTARLLAQNYGQWLVGALGVIIIGIGVAQVVDAWKANFEEFLAWEPKIRNWAKPVCQFGLIAWGFVFLIIGGFLIVAAIHFNSGEARGLSGALHALQAQPYGFLLLAVVALGLIAFAIYNLIESVYRRIQPPAVTPVLRQVISNR